jgi:hypothetical protein
MKISEQRIRNFALGILVALAGYALCACDGGTSTENGDAGTLSRTDSGVIHCDIPSPAGDVMMVNARCTSMSITMRDYYEKAAVTGNIGLWGVLTNLADLQTICAEQKTSSAECDASTKDFSKYCYVGACNSGSSGVPMTCSLGGVRTWTNSFQIDAALCTPQGKFAGWLCTPSRSCQSN